MVQRIRDEAHRFAITYHRNLRSKRSTVSPIDMVTGIRPKRKRMLMRRFGTLKGIKEAPVEEIAAVPGMTRSLASRLKEFPVEFRVLPRDFCFPLPLFSLLSVMTT